MKPNGTNTDDADFARFGRAAVIPGIQKAIEHLQRLLAELQTLNAASESDSAREFLRELAGDVAFGRQLAERPTENEKPAAAVKTKRGAGIAAYWARMTPKQKKAEMLRRGIHGRGGNRTHPSNPKHPNHEQWKINVAKGRDAAKRARAKAAA